MKMKIIHILYVFIIIITLCANLSYAGEEDDQSYSLSQGIQAVDRFDEDGRNPEIQKKIGMTESKLKQNLKDVSNYLYKILVVGSIVISLVYAGVLGIKFITGSVEEKVKVQESLVIYLIGCLIAFGAFTIWKVIVTLGNQL